MHSTIPDFLSELQSDGRSPKTVETYEGVIRQFTRWFEDTTGERFDPESVPDRRSTINAICWIDPNRPPSTRPESR